MANRFSENYPKGLLVITEDLQLLGKNFNHSSQTGMEFEFYGVGKKHHILLLNFIQLSVLYIKYRIL